MVAALELVAHAIDELHDLDPDSLSADELQSLVIGLHAIADRLTAVAAPLVDRWQHSGVWALDGSKSAAARYAREIHSSRTTARAVLRRASSLATMPVTTAAAITGDLSLDQVDLLARANTTARRDLFAAHEHTLVATIQPLRHREATRTVRYWCQRTDAELDIDDPTADHHHTDTALHLSPTLDDMIDIHGLLDPISGAIVTSELDRLTEQLRHTDQRDGIERTPTQRRAAALVEMATPTHLAPFLTTAMLETILFDSPTTIISVSKKRSFTGALRRAIEVRDRHCQHPAGCDTPADHCDIDHIQPHARGGPTSQANGRLQCPTHNRNTLKHDHDAQPKPHRDVTRLDEIRARIRWRMHQHHPDEMHQAS